LGVQYCDLILGLGLGLLKR